MLFHNCVTLTTRQHKFQHESPEFFSFVTTIRNISHITAKYLWTFYCLPSRGERNGENEKLKNNKNKVNKFQRTSSDHLLLAKESFLFFISGSLLLHLVPSEVIHLSRQRKHKRRAIWAEQRDSQQELALLFAESLKLSLILFQDVESYPLGSHKCS